MHQEHTPNSQKPNSTEHELVDEAELTPEATIEAGEPEVHHLGHEAVHAETEISDEAEENDHTTPIVDGSIRDSGTRDQQTDTDNKNDTTAQIENKVSETRRYIVEQLAAAATAYGNVAETLNQSRHQKDKINIATEKDLKTELETWLTPAKEQYVRDAMEANPDLDFTLVAAPNTIADSFEITDLAKRFGEDQPHKTHIYGSYTLGPAFEGYPSENISGTNPANGDSAKFSLIPNANDPRFKGTLSEQRAQLAELQATNPEVGLEVPSILTAVTRWQTLRSQGNQLTDKGTLNETLITHFNLPKRPMTGHSDHSEIPATFVRNNGEPCFRDLDSDSELRGLVAVG